MKRLLLFMCALVLTSVSAVAKDYPFKVMGIQVTSDNASSIYKIGGETVFRAQDEGSGVYWIYIRQPEGVDEIVSKGDNIIEKRNSCELHICVENDVVLRSTTKSAISSGFSGKLYFNALSGWNRSLKIVGDYGFWLNDDEIHISGVELIAPDASFISRQNADLFIEDYGFLSAFRISQFKSITLQPGAVTNAASISDTGDGNGVAARDEWGPCAAYMGLRKFPLLVGNVQVTDANAGNITGSEISALDADKPSKLSFDADKNLLVMDNVKLETSDMLTSGIRYLKEKGALNVSISNNSSIVSKYYGIESRGDVNITGGKKLYVEGAYGVIADGNVAIKGVCHAKGSTSAIYGTPSATFDLSAIEALKAEGDYVVIGGFGKYEGPKTPAAFASNATFSDTDDGYGVAARDEEGSAISGIAVVMAQIICQVADREVTAADEYFSDGTITGEGISGKVTLKDGEIWLEDATIEATTDEAPVGISNIASAVVLRGKNTIKAKKTGILFGGESPMIMKTPEDDKESQLTITAGEDGISTSYMTSAFRVKDVTLEIDAARTGIKGYNGKPAVEFENCFVRLLGREDGAMRYIAGIDYYGVAITTPGVTLETDIYGKCLQKDSKLTTDWVEFRPIVEYIKVGDLVVTELNVDEQPFSHPSITGSVTYDKETGVLTLENATIISSSISEYAIAYAAPDKLSQIVLKGDNSISWGTFEDKYVIECRNDLLITGGGSLTATEGVFYVYGKENPKIQISDVTMSVMIESMYGGTIELDNCSLDKGSISNGENVTLKMNNCTFDEFYALHNEGTAEVTDCTFKEMEFLQVAEGTMTLNNCTWTNGRQFFNEGITNINNSTVDLSNLTFEYFGCAIMNSGSISLNANSTVSGQGTYFGYYGEEKSSLTVNNSVLRLKAENNVLIDGEDILPTGAATGYNLTLTDVELYASDGETIEDGKDGYFELQRNGERATDWVEIGYPKYFKIGDLEVTGRNLEEQPYSDPSIEGTVTYDKDTGVLTLDGVSVTSESVGLDVGHGSYKGRVSQIVFKGENTITSESDMIYNRSALTISGSGALKGNNAINNDDTYAYLRIYGCNLECGGICNNGSLDIANSRVVANGIYNSAACSMNITSSTLTIEDKIEDGIYNDGTIYIGTDSHVDATGPKYGYRSEETTSSVTIDNSTLRLNNGDGIVVAKGYNLNLWSEVELETSGGATLYEGKDEYFEAKRGETPSEWTVFTVPADKKTYDIHVGGTQVTGLNYENVTSPSITGQVSYDPLARRLTLTNATIGDGGVSFGYSAGSAELMLNGDNAITGVDPMGCSLIANQELTITSADGKGKLAIDNEMFSAFTGGTSTVIRNCELDFKSAGYGMTGMGPLTIESGKVRVKGETGSLLAFSDITFGEDIIFDKPDNCYYNKETSQLEVEGELVTGEVIIRYLKNYDIMVGTTKVNSDNYNDIKPAELKAGSISFDPEKYELILSEAQLEGSGITANPGIEELTLVVDGECSITGAVVPMKLMCPAFIISKNCADAGKPGQGILNDKLTIATDGTGVYFDGMLFLNDIAMTVTAGYKALAGSGPGSLIYINTSNIEVTGTSDGAITSVGLLSLYDRTRFTNPAQSFDEEAGWVSEGGVAAKSVTIKYYMPGDANVDYLVDVADVRAVANDIWEVEQPWFEAYNADLNTDDVINVTDIVGVVDIILESSATARAKNHAMLARRGAQEANDRLSLVNRNGLLTAALTNADGYYGLQMNLRLSPGQTLNDITLCGACADSHQVAWRQTGDDTFRVVVYALSPAALIGGSSQMLTFDIEGEGTVEADDILAVTTDGTRRMLAPAMGDVVTGITETMATEHDAAGTYDLNGRKVSENSGLKKGIYIRNGKKFIVK